MESNSKSLSVGRRGYRVSLTDETQVDMDSFGNPADTSISSVPARVRGVLSVREVKAGSGVVSFMGKDLVCGFVLLCVVVNGKMSMKS